jgi:uncharacterized membrane protein
MSASALSRQRRRPDWSESIKRIKGFFNPLMQCAAVPAACPSRNPQRPQNAATVSIEWPSDQETARLRFRAAETHARSILKAISWRTLGTLDTFAISWFITGRVEIAGSIAGLELATKVAWYYLHERVWAAIDWGRRHI